MKSLWMAGELDIASAVPRHKVAPEYAIRSESSMPKNLRPY